MRLFVFLFLLGVIGFGCRKDRCDKTYYPCYQAEGLSPILGVETGSSFSFVIRTWNEVTIPLEERACYEEVQDTTFTALKILYREETGMPWQTVIIAGDSILQLSIPPLFPGDELIDTLVFTPDFGGQYFYEVEVDYRGQLIENCK
jgi:hypothetical protein